MNLLIVESPAKAKTINKYLGSDYKVLASFGHIRDLPAKNGSVRPDENFAMTYEVSPDSEKRIKEIVSVAKNSKKILLATDPDREGEAISWHVLEILKQRKAIAASTEVKRVVFNEITKSAVKKGVDSPRDIDMNLVNSQQARRALDYLVGFTLSPLLWRKLPGSRSAGRVQSVALRLICEREDEIEKFIEREYWDITANLQNQKKESFSARLTSYNGDKVEQFYITNEKTAHTITNDLKTKSYKVMDIENKQSKRNPYAPFTTSTLQQEASRKLGFSTSKTMQVAQKLYEGIDLGGETVGLITYMRTDGVQVSNEAINDARSLIEKKYGANYVPASPRVYKTKAKNAQEAHEAIRPTDISKIPDSIEKFLDKDQYRLYDLIWKRMIASQMESAIIDQVAADIGSEDKKAVLRANGSVVKFDGFFKVYREDRDDDKDEDENKKLPILTVGEPVSVDDIIPAQHFTQAPPRYSEASLVKKLEELGIGRPSTYSSIISVLIKRDYVVLDKKRFFPQEKGRVVSAFLVSFFSKYVEYNFTAGLEEQLDNISAGEIDWKKVLREFWDPFHLKIGEVAERKPSEIFESIEKLLENHLFPEKGDGKDPRACTSCADGRLSLKMGKFGAFIGCSNYPTCNFTKQITKSDETANEDDDSPFNSTSFPKELGVDPKTGVPVSVKKGPYGIYIEIPVIGSDKPKRAPLPREISVDNLSLEMAINLASLPREVGNHPETGKPIMAGIGRYGPYLLHNGSYTKLHSTEEVLSIGINRAVDLISASPSKSGIIKTLGQTQSGEDINLCSGRYGIYLKVGKNNYRIPKKEANESLSLERALEIIGSSANGDKPEPKAKAKAKSSSAKTAKSKKEDKSKETPKPKTAPKAKAKKKTTAKA